MAFYGERINYDYDPVKEIIYNMFAEYFENPKLRKLKNIGNYSMYITKIHAILGIEFRYIIIFSQKDNENIGKEINLNEINWLSFQTRTLTDEHDISYHYYTPKKIPELNKSITIIKKDEKGYIYKVQDLPLQITLLPKSKGLDYSDKGTVLAALETYQTVINFI